VKLAMAQISMSACIEENLNKALHYMAQAAEASAELIFFPEVQLSPFFPQYEGRDADTYLLDERHPAIRALCDKCRQLSIYASPNVYLMQNGRRYDASLFIDSRGHICGISKMVHITQAVNFYEQDYYSPSDDGFHVYETPFGKIGIVICFDRHLPESFRTCALKGADLILIPTANLTTEPLELFSWELRVQAMQNTVFAAMCNRVGTEGQISFAGQSMIADPIGNLLARADDREQLLIAELPLETLPSIRCERPFLSLVRPEFYWNAQNESI